MRKIIFKFFQVPLLILLFAVPLFSDDRVTVAVLDLSAKGIPQILANAVSDIIRSEFVNIGNFTVVERTQMNAILEEQGLQMTGCTDSACAVKFGKMMSARRIVIGEVNKIGKRIVITARYVNVASGESLFSASAKAQSIDVIDEAAKKIAKNLANKIISGDKEVITPQTIGGYYSRSIVPGWGQFYAGNTARGYVYSGVFALSCIASGYLAYNFLQKKSDYEDMPKGVPLDDFKNARDDYEKSALYANVSFGIIGVVYLAHWIDILFFTKSDFDKMIALDGPETGFFISGINSGTSTGAENIIVGCTYKF